MSNVVKNYYLFDIEVMSKDLKIYMIHNKKTSIIDVKNINEFMDTLYFIIDNEDANTYFVGDYFIGFDIPLLFLIRDFYIKHRDNYDDDKIIGMLIDFAYDKTQKLIRYGCSDTSAEFDLIKQKLVFNSKYIDVKFLMSTKLQYTSLKHFQGAILNVIQDFDFDTNDYNVESLDKYGINDVKTSLQRFEHATTQSLYQRLYFLSKKTGINLINFSPNNLINYLIKNTFDENLMKTELPKKEYKDISDIGDFTMKINEENKEIISNVARKLNDGVHKQKTQFCFLNKYQISISQFDVSVYNTEIQRQRQMHKAIVIDISEAVTINIAKCLTNLSANKVLGWMLHNQINSYFFLSNKIMRALYIACNLSAHSKTIDYAVIDNLLNLLNFIQAMDQNNIEIIGIVENKLFVCSENENEVSEILKNLCSTVKYMYSYDECYIYDNTSIISKNGINTGIFDIEYRAFEKHPFYPSIASVKRFVNTLICDKYVINKEDYIFISGPCVLGLQDIKERAVMLTYGKEMLIINKGNHSSKLKMRFQSYNENISIESLKHYYDEEFEIFFNSNNRAYPE